MEEWKFVPGYVGYEISSIGRVRSYHVPWQAKLAEQPVELLLSMGPTGHVYAGFKRDGINTNQQVGYWVLCTFVRLPEAGEECRHLDGDPWNNEVSNLQWGTRQENVEDRLRHGTHNFAKLTVEQVKVIRDLLCQGVYGKDIAALFSVSPATISEIKNNKIWRFI